MLRILGSAPILPATAHLLAHPEQPSHLGWISPRGSHLRPDQLKRDLSAAKLSRVLCPDCGAEMHPEAFRALSPLGGPSGVALDAEFCCRPCRRFLAVSALFAGMVLACGFAAAEALALRSGQPPVARDRWPPESEVSLESEYKNRGAGWTGSGVRRSWILPGAVMVQVTMGTWESDGGRTRGEDLHGKVTLPDGSSSTFEGGRHPLKIRRFAPDGSDADADEITKTQIEPLAKR